MGVIGGGRLALLNEDWGCVVMEVWWGGRVIRDCILLRLFYIFDNYKDKGKYE